MQIKSSSIDLQSKNSAYSLYAKTERLQINRQGSAGQTLRFSATRTEIKEERYLASWQNFAEQNKNSSLRDKADKLVQQLGQNNNLSNQLNNVAPENIENPLAKLPLDAKLKLLLLMMLLGRFQKDPKLMKDLGLDEDSFDMGTQAQVATPQNNPASPAANTPPPIVEYKAHETLYQSETAQFSAQGEIKTADGQTLNINVNLTMARETLESNDTQLRLQAATKDPLVINLDGSAAQLSEQRFSFDLTSDGVNELIPKLLGNRAFLALDKNNDGAINNGTELFGAQTGNGFSELAQYDEDKNGWIDENDSVYKNLKLWINAGTDLQKLLDLKAVNIGALYTGSAPTSFHLQDKNDSQTNLGIIQATGLFLKENGEAGTIQHVDLTV